jgi:hypothetical protein
VSDGGLESLRKLWLVQHAGRAEPTDEPEYVPPEQAVREAEVLAPLPAHLRRRMLSRLVELRLRFDSADALADWLRRGDWEWYGTLTFRDCRDPAYAMRVWRKWLDRINRRIWGRRYRKSPAKGVWGFVAWERQARGAWHAHFVLAGAKDTATFAAMRDWEAVTRTKDDSEGSYARIFRYDPTSGGAGYCAKYVTKEAAGNGTWELFGHWPPERWPLLYDAAQA